jgi:hypothetical protein
MRSLALGLGIWSSITILTLPALAIEPGVYTSGGSRYIRIERLGKRLCYQGRSRNGVTTASLFPVRGGMAIYGWNKDNRPDLVQTNPDTLAFGNSTYTRVYGDMRLDNTLSQCLRSNQDFFQQN